ncbi:MAG: hypothetical protein HQ575_00205 [Candidatus Omnitrophica bacterium]|nr:hypothetical protein [Candidatus Omnitrophota bacterium]
MINRKKLTDKIDTLIGLEKELVPLFSKHITSSLPFSSLSESDRYLIMEEFKKRVNIQKKHVDILTRIKKDLMKGKKDVY